MVGSTALARAKTSIAFGPLISTTSMAPVIGVVAAPSAQPARACASANPATKTRLRASCSTSCGVEACPNRLGDTMRCHKGRQIGTAPETKDYQTQGLSL